MVTANWWNDEWLNEGFSEFMSQISVESLNQEFQIMKMIVKKTKTMKIDQLITIHSISLPEDFKTETHVIFPEIISIKVYINKNRAQLFY